MILSFQSIVIQKIPMSDSFRISKVVLEFEIDVDHSNKAIDYLEITNTNPLNRLGFKIKSTNIARYVVSPSNGILNPLKKEKISVVLTLHPGDNIENIDDRFRVYCLEIKDEFVTKRNIDKYLKDNEDKVHKVSLNVKVTKRTNSLSEELTTSKEFTDEMARDKPDASLGKGGSSLFEAFDRGSIVTAVDGSKTKSRIVDNKNIETVLIEKENDILKLRESNTMLKMEISIIKRRVVSESKQTVNKRAGKIELWQLLFALLAGILMGAILNSTERS